MQELEKINRTIAQQSPTAILKNILVIDGTIGKNSIDQVRAFNEITKLDGLVISKVDAKAKAGLILNIVYEFNLPIYFLGTGEQPENLTIFEEELYINLLVEGFKDGKTN